jgi:hypothetical protein
MTFEEAGIIAEVVSAIAVVVSLLYLAVQIRHSSLINEATTRTHLTELSQNILYNGTDHAEIFAKANAGESLTDAERIKITFFYRAAFRGFENYVYQRNLGLFDEREWKGISTAIGETMLKSYVQEEWRAVRQHYSEALQAMLDPLVRELEK